MEFLFAKIKRDRVKGNSIEPDRNFISSGMLIKDRGLRCCCTEPRRLTETRLEWQTQSGLVQVQGRGRRKHHQTKRWQRAKRSISRPRHVEALVVADTTMMAFHQDGDVETYLLTIMNMVSSLYLDPTIGNFINVVVVRIILVEEDDAEVRANYAGDVRYVQQLDARHSLHDTVFYLVYYLTIGYNKIR